VLAGEARFTTGPDYPGVKLRIEGPSAMVDVVGTTLAVIVDGEETCVCVLEGEAMMMHRMTGDMAKVPSGMRRVVDMSGNAVEEEITPMERMKLDMLRSAASEHLGGK
jgi:ferric-dicitrate binding protein FerR (iron transport regulator)